MAETPKPIPCPTCGRTVVGIALQFEGTDVVMRSCAKCDARWWETPEGIKRVEDLLGREPMLQPALR